jgi:hypothetical protein
VRLSVAALKNKLVLARMASEVQDVGLDLIRVRVRALPGTLCADDRWLKPYFDKGSLEALDRVRFAGTEG